MKKGRYFVLIFFLALNITYFKAQHPIASNLERADKKEQSVRDYISFVQKNSDDFVVISGEGAFMDKSNELPIGGFAVNYYYEKSSDKLFEEDNLVLISYMATKNAAKYNKIFLFDKEELSYYNEEYSAEESCSLEVFFEHGKMNSYYLKNCPLSIDLEGYIAKVKEDYKNEDFRESIFESNTLEKK